MVAALAKLSAMKGRSWSEQKLCPVDPLSNPKVGGWAMGHTWSTANSARCLQRTAWLRAVLWLLHERAVSRVLALTAA